MSSIENKKVIISAGASGIGWATAKILDLRGAKVFVCDLDQKRINIINKNKKNNIKAFACNIDKKTDIENFFNEIKKQTKTVDCLINNVGVSGPTGPIETLDPESWENTFKTNVIGHFHFTKKTIPFLKKNKGGSIINISSTAGVFGFPLRSPYAASKAATISFTKTSAMELGKYNIRVNAVLPGVVKGTRMKKVINAKAKYLGLARKNIEKDFISMASMNCWIEESDIGKLCCFLISDDSKKISGQSIAVDGNTLRAD